MNKRIKHPMTRDDRRRSAEAKALGTSLYRQRRIDVKKRKILTQIKDEEAQHELRQSLDESDFD